jgi:polysaccharide export outer membrane protein
MRKGCVGNTVFVVLFALLFLVFSAHAQDAKAPVEKKAVQKEVKGEMAADTDSYVIGPEDVLFIHVWREELLTRQVPVRMDGKISLPVVNDVQAAGYTPLQLKEVLTKRLKEFVDNPEVSVIVMEANSYRVFVTGEVRTPGVYRLRAETSILEIIPIAGGFTEWADKSDITIVRKENGKEKRIRANYNRIVKGKDPTVKLMAGDVIVVP